MLLKSVILFTTIHFLAFAIALRWHFRFVRMPIQMSMLSLISFVCFIETIHAYWTGNPNRLQLIAGLILYFASGLIFSLSIYASRRADLAIAFEDLPATVILSDGPYRFVRHPFYTSYILFWLAGAVGSTSILAIFAFPLLTTTYVLQARREEADLIASNFGEAYRDYQSRTGFMVPRVLP